MKVQSLAIIFILIILPITILLAEYANAQVLTFEMQQQYDSRLLTATYDALKAFQINTFNDTDSDIVDTKLDSIEASANAFYNSMGSAFDMEGFSKDDLHNYTPALVYTMYDGYYIYSPYNNIAAAKDKTDAGASTAAEDEIVIDTTPKAYEVVIDLQPEEETKYGFKPYVYYSCRYKVGTDSDFVITYSLDNYISIQGILQGTYVKKSGYLITIGDATNGLYKDGTSYKYDGIEILSTEGVLEENILYEEITTAQKYKYIKLNGTKYYWDPGDGTEENPGETFHLANGARRQQYQNNLYNDNDAYDKLVQAIQDNNTGEMYYKDAYEFTNWLTTNTVLSNLTFENWASGKEQSDEEWKEQKKQYIPDEMMTQKIFANDLNTRLEYSESNFNTQRKAAIRYSIESNLSTAIANFNFYSGSTNEFQMPKLKDTEWELLENQVSIISFLQGISIGGKIYNGHAVVTNDKTEEVIKEEDIYITISGDEYYHQINDKDLVEANVVGKSLQGVWGIDFQIRRNQHTGLYYVPRDQIASYSSVVAQNNINNSYDTVYEYLKDTDNIINSDEETAYTVKQAYYTALGRERWGMYKIESPTLITTLLSYMDFATLPEGAIPEGGEEAGGEEEETPPEEEEEEAVPEEPTDTTAPEIIIENEDGVTDGEYTIPLGYSNVYISKKIIVNNEAGGTNLNTDKFLYIFTQSLLQPSESSWQNYGGTGAIVTQEITEGGTWYLYVKAADITGNEKVIKETYTITKEEPAPTYEIQIVDTDGVNKIYNIPTNGSIGFRKQISVASSNGNTDGLTIKYSFVKGSGAPTTWTTYSSGSTITRLVNYASHGYYYLHVKVLDASGNVVAEKVQEYIFNGALSYV